MEDSKWSIYFALVVSSLSCFAANIARALLHLVVLLHCLLLVRCLLLGSSSGILWSVVSACAEDLLLAFVLAGALCGLSW